MGNNYRRGKMHRSDQNIKTVGKMLLDAIFGFNYEEVSSLVKQVKQENNIVGAKRILNKALGEANEKAVDFNGTVPKGEFARITSLLTKELKDIYELAVSNDVETTASSQEVPVVGLERSESSLSSEEDNYSKLENDDQSDNAAGISSDSNSNSPFEKINEESHETVEPEATVSVSEMPSVEIEEAESNNEQSGNLNDEKDDQQNVTIPTVSSSVSENIGSNSASEEGSLDGDEDDHDCYYHSDPNVDNDQKQDIQPEALASKFEIENVNTVNQSAERVEKIANEDTLPELEIVATSALPKATANGTVSSNSVPCTLRVELTSDDEDVNNNINVNQPTEHVEQVANGNGQPKTELPRINEQSSKNNQKTTVPQNTKKYVVAASALAITGIALGVAVAVYLEMLAVEIGIAIAACCLIAATVTYCVRPQSLDESKVEKINDTQKSTPCCS